MFELDGIQYSLEEIQGFADERQMDLDDFVSKAGLAKVEEGKTIDPPAEEKEGSIKDTASSSVDTSSAVQSRRNARKKASDKRVSDINAKKTKKFDLDGLYNSDPINAIERTNELQKELETVPLMSERGQEISSELESLKKTKRDEVIERVKNKDFQHEYDEDVNTALKALEQLTTDSGKTVDTDQSLMEKVSDMSLGPLDEIGGFIKDTYKYATGENFKYAEKIDLDVDIAEALLNDMDNRKAEKAAKGMLSLQEKEEMLTNARVTAFQGKMNSQRGIAEEKANEVAKELQSINNEIAALSKVQPQSEEELKEIQAQYQNLKNQFDEGKQAINKIGEEYKGKQDYYAGMLGMEIGEDGLKINPTFSKSKEVEELRKANTEALGGFLNPLGKLQEGVQNTAMALFLGLEEALVTETADAFTDSEKYTAVDAFRDVFHSNLLGNDEGYKSYGIDEVGFDSPQSIATFGAELLPFTLGIMFEVRRGKVDQGIAKLGKYTRFGKDMKSSAQTLKKYKSDILMSQATYRMMIADAYKEANDLGLEGANKHLYAQGTTVATVASQLVMPDYKFTQAGLNAFKEGKRLLGRNLKEAVNLQAGIKAAKNFTLNTLKEYGEEELDFFLREGVKMATGLETVGWNEFLQEQKGIAYGVGLLSGSLGSIGSVSTYNAAKAYTYKAIQERNIEAFELIEKDIMVAKAMGNTEYAEAREKDLEYAYRVVEAVKHMPKQVSVEEVDLMIEKNRLIDKKKNLDKAYHESIDAQITTIDNQIKEGKSQKFFEKSIDEQIKKINEQESRKGKSTVKTNTKEEALVQAEQSAEVKRIEAQIKEAEKQINEVGITRRQEAKDKVESLKKERESAIKDASSSLGYRSDDGQIVINTANFRKFEHVTTPQHELFHDIIDGAIDRADADVFANLKTAVDAVLSKLPKDHFVLNRMENYKDDKERTQVEEALVHLAQKNVIDNFYANANAGLIGKVKLAISKAIGFNKDVFKDNKSFTEFLKGFEGQKNIEGKDKKLRNIKPSDMGNKFSKDDLYTRTEKIYEEYGPEAGGFLIGEEYKNEIKRRLRKYKELQGFAEAEEDIIADAAYASNQSVRRLVETYKPDSGVPLNAWINKSLNAKILGAVQAAGIGGEFSAGEASDMKTLAADDASDVAFDANAAEAQEETLRKEKFPNFIEAIKPDEAMVDSITNTLNRVIARTITSFNEQRGADASTTPWVNNMKKELATELMPEINDYIKEYGYEKFLIDYRTAILANYTTTFLAKHPTMRKSVLKKVAGKWTPPTKVVKGSSFKYEWVDENGKKLKIDRATMKELGKASGPEMIKRNPDLDTLSENEFVDYHFDDGANRSKAKQNPKKSLAMQIGSELAFDILNKDLNEFGPISQRLKEVAELRDIVVVANFQEQITKDIDRGVVKFSTDNDATLIGDYLTDASNHNKVRSAINTFLRMPKSKSSIYSGAKEVFYNFDFVKDLEKIGVTDKGLEKLLKYFNSGRQQDYLTFGKLLLNKSNRTAKGTRGVSQEGYDAILSFPTKIVEDFITEIREKHKGKINGKNFKETNLFAYAVGNTNLSPKQVKGLMEFSQSSKVSATDIDAFEKRYHKDLLGSHYLSSKFTEIMDGLYPVFAKAIANSNDPVTNITMLQNLLGSISINEKNLPNSLFFNTVVSPILDSYGIESNLKGNNQRFIDGEASPLFKGYKRKINDLKSQIIKGDEKSIINSVKEINKTANENKDFLLKSIEYLSEVYNSDFINDQDKKTIEDVLIFSTKRESLIPNSTPIELVMRNDKLKSEKDYTWEHITRIKDISDQVIKYIKGDKEGALKVINNYKAGIIPTVVAEIKTDNEGMGDLSISLSQTPLQAMGILVESNMPGTKIVDLTDNQIDQAKKVKESKDTVSYKHSFDTDLGLQWNYYDGRPFTPGFIEGNSLESSFDIDGEKYKVIVGHTNKYGSMGVSFVTIDEHGESFAPTKRGKQFTILGGIANATQDLANKLNVTQVEFTGTGNSRVKAYSALAKMLAKKHGWVLTEEISPSTRWSDTFDPDDYTDGDFMDWMDQPENHQRLIDDGMIQEESHIHVTLERDEQSALDAYVDALDKSVDKFDTKYSMDTKIDLDWKQNSEDDFNSHEAIFELDKEKYKILSYDEGDFMDLSFFHEKDGEWRTSMTNFGNPFKVLSAVSNGALKFAAEKGIDRIHFSGSGLSRVRAYKTLAKMFAAKGGFDIEMDTYKLFSDEEGKTMDVIGVFATRNQNPNAKYSLDTKVPLDAKLKAGVPPDGNLSRYEVLGSRNGTDWMDHTMTFELDGNEYEISLGRYQGTVFVDFYQIFDYIEKAPDEGYSYGDQLYERGPGGKFRAFIGEGPLPEGYERIGKTKTTNATGSGNPFKVLSIVSNAALDFADKYGLFEVEFSGFGASRVKAYQALAKMLVKKSNGDWIADIEMDGNQVRVIAMHLDRRRAFEDYEGDGPEYDTKFSMDSNVKVDWKPMDKKQIADYPYYMQAVLELGVIADFEIDGNEYLMKIMPEFGTMRDINFAFSQVLDNGTETLSKTGTGNAFKVFGTVGNALVDYMNSKPGQMTDSIHFTGEGQSRAKLYVRLGKMLAKQLGWKVHMDYQPSFVKVVVHHPAVNPTGIDFGLQNTELDDYIDMRYSQDRAVFDLNEMIERKSGIKTNETLSDVRAKMLGSKEKGTFFVPYSNEDFMGFMYMLAGKGKQGEADLKRIKELFIRPFSRAEVRIASERKEVALRFKELKDKLKKSGLKLKDLRKESAVKGFTKDMAVRVYIWNQQMEEINIPGLSDSDVVNLTRAVNNDPKLLQTARELMRITEDIGGYPSPSTYWDTGNVARDLTENLGDTRRKYHLAEWQSNIDAVFDKDFYNKLTATFGEPYVKYLKESIAAMKRGKNRIPGKSKIVNSYLDFVNGAVGSVMFWNQKTAILQQLSNMNFLNWSDNNIFKASQKFANQSEYWKTFIELFNSDYLVNRRDGLKINVSESELMEVANSKNPLRALAQKLIRGGFTPTRWADSFAIATGGTTFYLNRIDTYVKQGMTEAKAKEQAFIDFTETAEDNQQSSRTDKIGHQQRSSMGRLVLAFANTPIQYARITKKSFQDLVNRRGNQAENISKILYYGALQNIIFSALQQGMFALLFDDEDDEEGVKRKTNSRGKRGYNNERELSRAMKALNGTTDSMLRGLGVYGATVAMIKNVAVNIYERSGRRQPNFKDAAWEVFSLMPPVDSKVTKIRQALATFDYEMDEVEEKGWKDLSNPAYLAGARVTAVVTNVGVDRLFVINKQVQNLMDENLYTWQRVFSIAGYQSYELGIDEKAQAKRKKAEKAKAEGKVPGQIDFSKINFNFKNKKSLFKK